MKRSIPLLGFMFGASVLAAQTLQFVACDASETPDRSVQTPISLRLESQKTKVEIIVIDHVEKPPLQ